MKPTVSFIIPAFNEEEHLGITVSDTRRVLETETDDFEIIIVDDGSVDQTGVIADELAKTNSTIKVLHNGQNKGFSVACRWGIENAGKEYVGWVSADTSWDDEALKEAMHRLGQADIITTYYVKDERPFLRRIISKLFTLVLNTFFLLTFKYYNGGCFHRTALLKQLRVRSRGLTFWAEVLIRLLKSGFSVIEIGVANKDRKTGRSKAFKIKNVLSTLEMILMLTYDVHILRQKKPQIDKPFANLQTK